MPDEITKIVVERLLDQQEKAQERYSTVVEGMDDVVHEITTQLGAIATAREVKEQHDQIIAKISDHNKDCDLRTDEVSKCINAKNNVNVDSFRERNKEVDGKIIEVNKVLDELKRNNTTITTNISNIEITLKDVQEKIKTMIIIVSVAFALFLGIYTIASYVAKTGVEDAVKAIVSSRAPQMQQGMVTYWTDDQGRKRYIQTEHQGERVDAPKQLPPK